MDAGRFHVVKLGLRYDTRNDRIDPWSGWFVTGDYEYGTGAISSYAPTSPGVRDENPSGRTVYDRVFVDIRRYNRLSSGGQVNLRLVLGGWLSGDELPLQRRFAVGGAGSLPGYDFRQLLPGPDFLACSGTLETNRIGGPSVPLRPGARERMMLGQLEYGRDRGASLRPADGERRHCRCGGVAPSGWCSPTSGGWLVGLRVATCSTAPDPPRRSGGWAGRPVG